MSDDLFNPNLPWADDATADPVADIRSAVDIIANTGYGGPPHLIMSSTSYEAYLRYTKWREQTEMWLASTPRHRVFTQMVLKRQLHGPLHKRYRPRWWYRLREWNRERTGWYGEL